MCRTCSLRGAALCHAIADSSLPASAQPRQRQFARDSMIIEERTEPQLFGVLHSGYLRQEKLHDDGRRTLLGLIRPGDLIGGLPGTRMDYTIEAATDVEICALDMPTLSRLMTRSRTARLFLLRELARQHRDLLDQIWRRGLLSGRERIIAFLVSTTEFMPTVPHPDGSLDVTIDLSRRDWAALSNSAVETISRTMTWLSDQGLVTTLPDNSYRIHDLPRLRGLAGIEDRAPPPQPRRPRRKPRLRPAELDRPPAPPRNTASAGQGLHT